MLQKTDPTKTNTWKSLERNFGQIRNKHLVDLFDEDPERFNKFSLKFNDILLDYSKNRITDETLHLLLDLADEVGLNEAIDGYRSFTSI